MHHSPLRLDFPLALRKRTSPQNADFEANQYSYTVS